MKKLNQAGFSVVEALLVIVIVAILGGTGFFVYKAQNNANNALDSADKSAATSQTKIPKKSNDTKNDGDSYQAKYLEIKEWGVKIGLTEQVSGAYYKLRDDESGTEKGNYTNIDAYATETRSITGPAGVNCDGEYLAYMLRLPSNDPAWNSSENMMDLFTERKTIGDYTYAMSTRKFYGPSCFAKAPADEPYEVDTATQNKFNDVVSAFKESFKSIQAIN